MFFWAPKAKQGVQYIIFLPLGTHSPRAQYLQFDLSVPPGGVNFNMLF